MPSTNSTYADPVGWVRLLRADLVAEEPRADLVAEGPWTDLVAKRLSLDHLHHMSIVPREGQLEEKFLADGIPESPSTEETRYISVHRDDIAVSRLSNFAARYKGSPEAIAALVLGGGFSVLALTNTTKGNELPAATLVTLASLAFALLHEHALRDKTNLKLDSVDGSVASMQKLVVATTDRLDSVDQSVGRMEKLFQELNDPVPYHVLRYEAEWDLRVNDGSLAYAWQRKLLKFNQNDVVSLWFWAKPDGTEDAPTLNTGKVVDTFLSPDGKRKSLISLGRAYMRGEELQFNVSRTLHNSFSDQLETVAVITADSTAFLVLKVTFPADRSPTDIRLLCGEGSPVQRCELADILDVNRRPFLRIEIPDPPRGVIYTVSWKW